MNEKERELMEALRLVLRMRREVEEKVGIVKNSATERLLIITLIKIEEALKEFFNEGMFLDFMEKVLIGGGR